MVLNSADAERNITYSFATTTNIIWRGGLCGELGDEHLELESILKEVFKNVTERLVGNDTNHTFYTDSSCKEQNTTFAPFGGGDRATFWTKNHEFDNQCELVPNLTRYSVYDSDDYKRCICEEFGAGL